MRTMRNAALALFLTCLTLIPAFGGEKQKKIDIDLEASRWALGIFLGEPTGVTVQVDIAEAQALEFKAAWNFTSSDRKAEDTGSLTIQGNYVLWFPGTLVVNDLDFPPFIGGGVEIRIGSDLPQIGVRIPCGVRYRFREVPVELALELGAGMSLFPETKFLGSGGLAVRWML